MPSGFQIFVQKSAIIFNVARFKATCLFFFLPLISAIWLFLLSLFVCVYLVYVCFCVLCFHPIWMSFLNSFSISFNHFSQTQPLSSNILLCPFLLDSNYMYIRTFNHFLYFSVIAFSGLRVFLCFIFFTLYWSAFEFTNLSCLILNFRYLLFLKCPS